MEIKSLFDISGVIVAILGSVIAFVFWILNTKYVSKKEFEIELRGIRKDMNTHFSDIKVLDTKVDHILEILKSKQHSR